jgi:hypothetical protein
MHLTDTKVKNAKTQAKPYKLADEKGLFLLVHPAEAATAVKISLRG